MRTEWDAFDVRTSSGLRVEVKSAAYLQSWSQRELSEISFDIAPKRGWDAATNTSAPVPCRSADVYVFALLAHQEKTTLDPLDLRQWHFYVASARVLDDTCRAQKNIRLSRLSHIAGAPVSFEALRSTIEAAGQHLRAV